jgi:uncharacterized membrane protein YbhN (UPF0104 family)
MRRSLRLYASVALLAFALYLLDWTSLVASTAKLTAGVLSVAVLLACAPTVPLVARWYLLARGAGGWYACSARYLYANLLSAVSPGSIAGDIYRYFAFRDRERDGATMIEILVRERIFGLMSMLIGLCVGAVGMQIAGGHGQQWFVSTLAIAAACGIVALLSLPGIIHHMPDSWRGGLQAALAIRTSRLDTVLLALSLAAVALWVLAVQYVATRLGLQLSWSMLLVIVTSVELVRFIPVTVQGIGLREGAFATLFGLFGQAHEDGFVLGAIAYIALSLSIVVTGTFGALMLARLKPSA